MTTIGQSFDKVIERSCCVEKNVSTWLNFAVIGAMATLENLVVNAVFEHLLVCKDSYRK